MKTKFNITLNVIKVAMFVAISLFMFNLSLAKANFNNPVTYQKNNGYASIIIDWNDDFNYKTVVNGKILYISFDKKYAKGFSEIKDKLPGYVNAYYVSKDLKHIKISMNADYIVRDYFQDRKLHIDIVGSEVKNVDVVKKQPVKPVKKEVVKPLKLVKKLPAKKEKISEEKIVKDAEKKLEEKIANEIIAEEEIEADLNKLAEIETNEDQILTSEEENISSLEGVLFADKATIKEEKLIVNIEDNAVNEEDDKKAKTLGSMSFSWDHPTHSAVFRKDGYLWVIFDRKKKFEIEEIVAPVKSIVTSAVIIPHSKATVLRFVTKSGVFERVRREKLLWIVDFTDQPQKLEKEINIQSQYSDFDGFKLHMNVENAGKVYSLVDPEIGDGIFVVPVGDSSYSISLNYDLPDLELLNSSQGIVVVPKNNNVNVISTSRMVDIFIKDDGLNITNDAEQIANMLKYMKNGDASQPFNLKQWARTGKKKFYDEIASMMRVISKWDSEKVNVARLELARFYVANGYGAEALGILNLILEKDRSFENNPAFYAVRGIANFLMERYDEALKDFSYEGLLDNDEAVLWRHIVKLTQNPTADLNSVILSYAGYVKTYPMHLKTKIYLLASYAALSAGDELTLRNYIREIGANKAKTKNQDAEYYYLISKYDILSGNYNSAIRNLEKVISKNSLKFSAYARKDLAMMKYEIARGSIDKAIAEFERLKYVWREPNYEKLILNYLVMLYDKNKDYIDEMRTLNTIKEVFGPRNENLDKNIKRKMTDLYFDLFVEGKADVYEPIQYLGLFQEFRWLLPKGKKGLEVAQSVSDRLVGVDLLDKAAGLLSDQILKNNLEPEDKLRVGARLALVYLLDNQPEMAIEALDDTEELDIENKNLYIQRKLVKARALSDMGKPKQAISLIKNNNEKDAVILRSEIYWDAKNWEEAANTIRSLIEKPKVNEPISDEQAQYILDWITALKMSNRAGVIARVRYKFLPHFEKSKYYTTFHLLTNDLRDDNINMKSIKAMVDDASRFGAFVKSYYEKIKNEGMKDSLE